jgi:hypothetical protein
VNSLMFDKEGKPENIQVAASGKGERLKAKI